MPRRTVTPTVRDLAWAAGFLEGEGTFRFCGGTRDGSQTVFAYQVNLEPLKRLLGFFGGRLTDRRVPYRGLPRPIHHWAVYGTQARGVMLTLYTFLSERRREQVKKALVQ